MAWATFSGRPTDAPVFAVAGLLGALVFALAFAAVIGVLFAGAGLVGAVAGVAFCWTVVGVDPESFFVPRLWVATNVARIRTAPMIPKRAVRGRAITATYRQTLDGCLGLAAQLLDRTAARIASSGASRPVQRSKLRAPWRTRTSRPSTVRDPAPRAHSRRAVGSSPL